MSTPESPPRGLHHKQRKHQEDKNFEIPKNVHIYTSLDLNVKVHLSDYKCFHGGVEEIIFRGCHRYSHSSEETLP